MREDSTEVSSSVGKTYKMENMYRYQVNTEAKFARTASVVFRPNKYKQETIQKQNDMVYSNVYRFDIVKTKRSMRKTWVHISDSMPGVAQNEIQVAPGDRLEIAFCIYNLNGFVDMSSLSWAKPCFAKIEANMFDFEEYNRDLQI